VGIIIDLLQKVFHAVLSMLQSSDMKPKATTVSLDYTLNVIEF
jgi:hypothetical protein